MCLLTTNTQLQITQLHPVEKNMNCFLAENGRLKHNYTQFMSNFGEMMIMMIMMINDQIWGHRIFYNQHMQVKWDHYLPGDENL